MPVNREPTIYQGYVISQISRNAGEKEEMPYAVAQSCVSGGTHRWADDETDMPNHVQDLITTRETEQKELDEANAKHNAEQRAIREAAEKEAAGSAGRPIVFIAVGDKVYLARPFPDTALFQKGDVEPVEGFITVTTENALADYKVVGETETALIAELLSQETPDVDITDDWRDKKPMQLAAMAKKLRGTKESMKADEARAILEEWTKKDDQVSVDPADGAQGEGQKPDTENRNQGNVPQVDNDGKPVLDPEARAQQAAREGIDDDDGF